EQGQGAMLADQLLADQLDRGLPGVHGRDVEDRDPELHRVGGGHLHRRHQPVVDQVLGQRLPGLGGRGHGLAGRGFLQHPVQHQPPGDAGDAHQVGVRDARHSEALRSPRPRLYPKPPPTRMLPPSHLSLPSPRERGEGAPKGRMRGALNSRIGYPSPGGIQMHLSIILPAKNESAGLQKVLPGLRDRFPGAEVIVVDDGSTDDTAEVARAHGAHVVGTPYSMGNGAAIKRGARAASGEILVFMDADGQHDPALIPRLLEKLDEGYDMVVGARDGAGQANAGRGLANAFYNRLSSWMTGHRIADLTS